MSLATSRVVNCNTSSARLTSRPRMRSRTSRALEAEPRRYLAVALVVGWSSATSSSPSFNFGPVTLAPPFGRSSAPPLGALLLAGVEPEGPGRAELAELVPDHRLGDVHRD